MLTKKLLAEGIGTFWLVFGGCGSAVFAAQYLTPGPDIKYDLGIGFVGVSLAFGLTVLTMAYAIGPISGCHLNPAVSVGLCTAGRFPAADLLPYIAAQTLGAAAGAGLIYLIVSGQADFKGFDSTKAGEFATNGYGAMSPGKFSLASCLVAEVVLTAFFLFIILGSTDRRAAAGFAPLPIGFGLTLIHLVSIPITNTSVNPARSTGVALFVGGDTLTQLWLFWLAPIVGAAAAAVAYRFVSATDEAAVRA